MTQSIFIDNEGNHRRVTDGNIEPKPGMGIPDSEKPRRYEVRDAETGEKLSGVSFILTPTGEEMHLLTDKGMQVGAMKDIGIYYHGELHDGHAGVASKPVLTGIALHFMASKIFKQLATGGHERYREDNLGSLKALGYEAIKIYEEHCQDVNGPDETTA